MATNKHDIFIEYKIYDVTDDFRVIDIAVVKNERVADVKYLAQEIEEKIKDYLK